MPRHWASSPVGKISRKGQVVRHESLTERFDGHQAFGMALRQGFRGVKGLRRLCRIARRRRPVMVGVHSGAAPPISDSGTFLMAIPASLANQLSLPVIGSPLFIISNPDLVIAQCKAGVVGSFPSLNARPIEQLDEWLTRINEELAAARRANPARRKSRPMP
jgi:hypothetical protein